MFGISYENWFQTCDAYQNMNKRRLEAYLQLYPLSRINDVDWDKLKSKEYFYEYIDKGTFVNNPFVMFHTSHYMQKVDGSFRDAELISPILFLVLLAVLKLEAPELYEYYSNYCRGITVLYVNRKCYLRRMVIEEDWVANYLYFMYIVRSDSSNHFEAFAFYKSFFDRFTGDLAYKTGKETKKTCYEKYYKEHQLKNFYSSEEARTAINRAHKLRMMNPITHASSEVITKPERMVELSNCAVALEEVIDSYLNENNQFITESNKA